jgi:hypothetical protein
MGTKGTKTPKKFSTQLSEGSWGYGGGTRVYKSKLPTIKNTYTNPKPVINKSPLAKWQKYPMSSPLKKFWVKAGSTMKKFHFKSTKENPTILSKFYKKKP